MSAAWMRSSSQCSAMWSKFSVVMCRSVRVCQRFMATVQPASVRRHERSMTSFSLPISELSWARRSGRNSPSGENSHEVMMMCDAPAVSHSVAFSRLIPPPICIPPGHADRASSAACLLPVPSWMM